MRCHAPRPRSRGGCTPSAGTGEPCRWSAARGPADAAAVVIDAVVRLLHGVLGHEDSSVEESYTAGLLDCPQYTRPEVVDGLAVPAVLLGGDHEAVRRWRLKQALGRTWLKRPALLKARTLTSEEQELLDEFKKTWASEKQIS